ncbi:ApeP family dehydratase [Vibrio sp. WXL103]|uniref:ApeP family dehydratase n=1 Tax=Vibrio sp. WXL103 TaxID=3450710 RepID=UPI003EC736DB
MKQNTYPSIEHLLPHNRPMILIDRVIEHASNMIVCEVAIDTDSFLFEAEINGVPAQVGIEYMAQTVAALGGIEASEAGDQPPIGFLLGARRYKHTGGGFQNGHCYQVHANELMRDDNMAVYQCQIFDEEQQLVASGQVNTVIASSDMLTAITND